MTPKQDLQLPAFGAALLDGKYAGVLTDDDGQPYLLILLDAKPADQLNWSAAQEWASALGAALPNRVESAQLFRALRDEFEKDWHWTSEAFGASCAWFCSFNDGYQGCSDVSSGGAARAVRRLLLQSFDPSSVSVESAAA